MWVKASDGKITQFPYLCRKNTVPLALGFFPNVVCFLAEKEQQFGLIACNQILLLREDSRIVTILVGVLSPHGKDLI